MSDARYGIFEIAKDDTPIGGGPFLTGPLSEVLACISMAGFNEKLVETNEQLSARELALNKREQTFNEQSTQLAHKLADSGTRIVDTFEKQRALSMKRAHAEQQRREERRVQKYIDNEWHDAEEPYAVDPKEREASLRDATELPPPGTSLENDDGDLEIKSAPSEEERYGPQDDEYPGDLPRELKKDVPAPSGSHVTPGLDPLGEPKRPRQIAQPTSVSLW